MNKKYELLDMPLADRLKLYQQLKHRLSTNYTNCLDVKLVNSKHITKAMEITKFSVNKLIMKYCMVHKDNKPNPGLYSDIIEFKKLERNMITRYKEVVAIARKFKTHYIKLSNSECDLLLSTILDFGLLGYTGNIK